jgi:Tol biopolymer transport system component
MLRNDEVLAQLGRILDSPVFANAARSKQFLEYCVNCTLRGERSQLKETTIAVEVFLREASYDPKVDPIVRVHARRVREKLEQYYRTAGRGDPISIELPKGSYVPQFVLSGNETVPVQVAPPQVEQPRLVELPRSIPVVEEVLPPRVEAHRRRSASFFLRWPLVLILIAVIAVSFWAWKGRAVRTRELDTLQPLSQLPPNITEASWSPDGRMIAYVRRDGDSRDTAVFVQEMQNGHEPKRLGDGHAAEYRPVWSPDGRQVAFIRMLDGTRFQIVRHDLASGAETPSRPFVNFFPLRVDHPTLDWSPDGNSLLTAEQTSPGAPVRLILMRISTGERSYLTSPPIGSSGDIEAKFSPDGRLVAFRRGGMGDLYVVGAGGEKDGKAERLTFDTRGVHGIAFTDGGQSILFGTHRSGNDTFSIYKIPVHGGPIVPVTPKGFAAMNPSATKEGGFSLEHTEIATQLMERGRGETAETELLPSGGVDGAPSYSPDGNSVAFLSSRSGEIELWDYRRGSAKPEQLTSYHGSGFLFLPRWAPDGRSIVFNFRKDGATNITVYDLASRQLRNLTSTQTRDYNPVFSRDGKYIFYSSNEDGAPRFWRMAVDGHTPAEPLFTEAVANFAPSADGQWLYYLDNKQPLGLCRLNLQDGTTQEVFTTDARPALVNSLVVTAEGIYLAVARGEGSEISIDRIDPVTFQAQTAWKFPSFREISAEISQAFDVSPDGKRLLTTHLVKYNSGLFLATDLH